jgi:regulator of protease activity HflC (stomatin/prohibitin superfamily)
MRSEIGKLTLDKTFEERDTLNSNIIKSIYKETKDWGILALRYEIKDIEPPQAIQNAMILQAEAERRKRASILTSEGDKIANINVAEADKKSAVLKAEGAAEAMIIQAEAQKEALMQIDAALKGSNGRSAAQFILG